MPTVSAASMFTLQMFTDAGALMASGRLYTFAPGTTTKKVAYTEPTGTTGHTYTTGGDGIDYIALNARGEIPAPLFLQAGGYDIVLKDADGNTEWTRRAYGIHDIPQLDGTSSTGTVKAATFSGTHTFSSGNLIAGTYTPTLTNGANVSGSATSGVLMYMRIGDVVHVAGWVSITPTAGTTETVISLSLPIASNFAATTDCAGQFGRRPTSGESESGYVVADTSNDRAQVVFYALSTTGALGSVTFSYRVL